MTTTISAGSLFCFSTGEHSDYGYAGPFVALEDIPRERLLEMGEECKVEHRRLNVRQPIHGMFIAAVIKAGLALSLTCTELHIGSYGQLDIEC